MAHILGVLGHEVAAFGSIVSSAVTISKYLN